MLWSIAFATPFFVLFGWLSDKIGRKWIMMTGMLLGILLYRPIFSQFLHDTNVKEWITDREINRTLLQSDTSKLDADGTLLVHNKYQLNYHETAFSQETRDTLHAGFSLGNGDARATWVPDMQPVYSNVQLSSSSYWKFVLLVWVMIVFVTMVYGPVAAFLVEMFPTRIRYTSMSLPYHIGNGVFGGLVPFIGLLLTTTFPSDPLVGLWYPIGVAALCLVIGVIYLRNKIDENVND